MSPTPLELARAEQKKWEMIAAVLENEETLSALRKLLLAGEPAPVSTAIVSPAKPKTASSAQEDGPKSIRGELDASVTKYVQAQSHGTRMNARSVADGMSAEGYVFAAKDHAIAVARVLRRLHEKGILNIHRDDAGNVTYTRKMPIREVA